MKINNNREFESMQSEGYFNTEYTKGDMPFNMDGFNQGYSFNSCSAEMMGENIPGVVCQPIYECPRETVCHRYICHEVPQE